VWCGLVDGVAVPLALEFSPELILISAGFDAHAEDSLAGCRVTDGGFAAMASSMRRVADSLGVPVGGVLEGGYALGALGRSVVATLEALASPGAPAGGELPVPLVSEAVARLTPWWPGLGV
jgi:acetoin utilization deacetylase AcuC-like enzyme